MLKTRKLARRSVSLHDRTHKSDGDDKNLSNDETPLPSCPRQPPDGVETPADAIEKVPDLPSRLPPKLPTGWPTRTRYSYSSRTQDARSEASVRDKIAMFSNEHTISSDRIDKCGTLPTRSSSTVRKPMSAYMNSYDTTSLDRRLTKSQDNLDEVPFPYTHRRHSERPEVMGAMERVTTAPNYDVTKSSRNSIYDSKPLLYGSTFTLSSTKDTAYVRPIYHTRSISDDNGKKPAHKSNLEYLIEQRKKSMSKLRGLVIPEAQAPIPDLPEIKVQDNLAKSFLLKSHKISAPNKESNKCNGKRSINLNDNKWNVNLLPNNIPKYSPAFKRKSLQVYSPPSTFTKESAPILTFNEKIEILNKSNVPNLTRRTIDFNPSDQRTNFSLFSSKSPSKTLKLGNKLSRDVITDIREFKNVEIKVCTATEVIDSDNDSAMSSTQSSYRSSASSPMHHLDSIESDNSRISPRISHYSPYTLVKTDSPPKSLSKEKVSEDFVKRAVCRSISSDTNVSLSSSAGSAATSGSQASCSSLESSVADSDKKKIARNYNVDTINRRNIVASAKCRSGRDDKIKSPLIEPKFSHEPSNTSPILLSKTSERLSSLTSSVSAVSNKGENRRRNKVVADSDSDSDCELNIIRQRKADFKNTRLKRNSSSANKSKQTENTSDSPKLDDAPKVISEKIIKEIKKAGLDNFQNNNKGVTKSDTQKENIIPETVCKNQTDKVRDIPRLNKNTVENQNKKVTRTSAPAPVVKNYDSFDSKTDSSLSEDSKASTTTVRLQRGAGSGVGLILAGGIDCEAKDVTIHRVLSDSAAAKAGLERGAKVQSINGHSMTGLTHAQSVAILKEQRTEVIIEIENEKRIHENGCGTKNAEVKNDTMEKETIQMHKNGCGSVVTVTVEKAGGGTGLGFGLDGGRDSPYGDRPLTIKKLFAGGAAAQCGRILVGAELLSAGGQSFEGFTRTKAWAALKALPVGMVTLVLRNP